MPSTFRIILHMAAMPAVHAPEETHLLVNQDRFTSYIICKS